jgi:hypothetical protein
MDSISNKLNILFSFDSDNNILQYLSGTRFFIYMLIIFLIIKYYGNFRLFFSDLSAICVYMLNFPSNFYNQKLVMLEGMWTNEGDCTPTDNCNIKLSISHKLDGELICLLTPDGGRFYGISRNADYPIKRFLRLLLFKAIRLYIFNIRGGKSFCEGHVKVKLLSSPSRFEPALIKVIMDKHLIHVFQQKYFTLFKSH